MTHDEIIAAGIWSGPVLKIRQRMAEYIVDGSRFGARELETKSGSINDVYLEKRTSEITTAAMLLSRLQYEDVHITSLDSRGRPLESPDLDVRLPDGRDLRVEVAEAIPTDDAKHDASRNGIETIVSDLLESDETFASAFGNFYFAMNLNGFGSFQTPISSKREMLSLASEIEQYIRTRAHQVAADDYFREFPAEYPLLSVRGANFHSERMDRGAHFSIGEGASSIGRVNNTSEVRRVLDKHRTQAARYRPGDCWMILFLTDDLEFFNNTIAHVVRLRPPIDPFERVYLMDSAHRLEVLT